MLHKPRIRRDQRYFAVHLNYLFDRNILPSVKISLIWPSIYSIVYFFQSSILHVRDVTTRPNTGSQPVPCPETVSGSQPVPGSIAYENHPTSSLPITTSCLFRPVKTQAICNCLFEQESKHHLRRNPSSLAVQRNPIFVVKGIFKEIRRIIVTFTDLSCYGRNSGKICRPLK